MAATALTLEEYGRALGTIVWLERRAFEVLGELAHQERDPAEKIRLAAQSAHHGFHAALLEPMLPSTRDHDPAALVDSGDSALAGPEAVLERLLEAQAGLVERLDAVADAATIRLLGLVALDHESDARGPRSVR